MDVQGMGSGWHMSASAPAAAGHRAWREGMRLASGRCVPRGRASGAWITKILGLPLSALAVGHCGEGHGTRKRARGPVFPRFDHRGT